MGQKSGEAVSKILPISLSCLTLFITPWYNFDSVTLPKFTLLTSVGFATWYLVFNKRKILISPPYRLVLAIELSFILWLLLVLLVNGRPNLPEFFGTYGRNTGFLTYMSFTGVLLLAFITSNLELVRRISEAIYLVGCATLFYGLIQYLGFDPFQWDNPYSPIVGTLGNPNFASSLLGLFGVILFSKIFNARAKDLAINFALLALTVWLIEKSDSVQGLFVLGLGIFVLITLFLWKEKNWIIFSTLLLVLGLLATLIISISLVGIGPLSSFATNSTVVFRLDYWTAGLRMARNNLLLGVGIDGYGDYYREFRTLEAATRRGPEVVTDASHNIFIDLLVSGGLPLLIIYFAAILLVLRSIFRILQNTNKFNPTIFGLFAIWIGHLAQSLVSINQIGLAVWFWAISGVILGYEKSLISSVKPIHANYEKSPLSRHLVGAFSLALIGLSIASPALIKDHNYRKALESREVTRISKVVIQYPRDSFFFDRTILLYKDNNLSTEILPLARQSIDDNPRNYWGWRLLAEYAPMESQERKEAVKVISRLDPYNPNNPK
ncbi:O-antigen ligase domain-containing protein [bacterium]|nr:O-antigen ligase domain-containing protein [bacterium]